MNCNRNDCDNLGTWSPVIHIWAKGVPKRDHDPIEIPIGLLVCPDHKKGVRVNDILDDDGFRRVNGIVKALGHKAADYQTAVLTWTAMPQSLKLN